MDVRKYSFVFGFEERDNKIQICNFLQFISTMIIKGSRHERKVQFFFNIVQKAFAPPPPPLVWTLCGEFTIIDKMTRKSMVKMLNLDNLTLYLGHF